METGRSGIVFLMPLCGIRRSLLLNNKKREHANKFANDLFVKLTQRSTGRTGATEGN